MHLRYPFYYYIRPEMMINLMIGPPNRAANSIAKISALPSMRDTDFLLAAIELSCLRAIGQNLEFTSVISIERSSNACSVALLGGTFLQSFVWLFASAAESFVAITIQPALRSTAVILDRLTHIMVTNGISSGRTEK